MTSPFIGIQVKLTLHSKPDAAVQAKILSIDPLSNTLTIQKDDGSQSVLKRTDIASLAAYTAPKHDGSKAKAASLVPSQVARPVTQPRSHRDNIEEIGSTATQEPSSPSKPDFVDPAIMSFTRSNNIQTPLQSSSPAPAPHQREQQHSRAPNPSAPVLVNNLSRSSTPAQSPRPKHAAVATKATKKKSNNPISRGSSPAVGLIREAASSSDDFDFGAGLAAFDKKKIWDEIRSSDHTDPASLLVSHNRISSTPTPLLRGPNGVGPANSIPAPQDFRGRGTQRDGQEKLRPNEMVCSPSPERMQSPSVPEVSTATHNDPQQSAVGPPVSMPTLTGKPTYKELETKIFKLEAELALAQRRNVLLEELAGLGRGVSMRVEETASPVASPSQQAQIPSSSVQSVTVEPSTPDALQSIQSLSLHPAISKSRSSTPVTSEPGEGLNKSVSPPAVKVAKEQPLFGHIVDPPVLTLLFPTAAIQHATLARMEAFYEGDSSSKRYLSLTEASEERICRNYQGFNFPVEIGVKQWLVAMWDATSSTATQVEPALWWEPHCSKDEKQLLDLLLDLGTIIETEGYGRQNSAKQDSDSSITYVISSTASQANSTLPHELLHALYFLSPSYRSFVSAQWSSLTTPIKKVIETDLGLRKYSDTVYEDEFQAYLAEGLSTEKEFGNKPAAECKHIGQQLRKQVQLEWSKLGYTLQGKESTWEDAKWDTLDRYAARQKAIKKSAKGTGTTPNKKLKK